MQPDGILFFWLDRTGCCGFKISFPQGKPKKILQPKIFKRSGSDVYYINQPSHSRILSIGSSKKLQSGNISSIYFSNNNYQPTSNCSSNTQSGNYFLLKI